MNGDRIVRFSFADAPVRGRLAYLEHALADAGAERSPSPAAHALLGQFMSVAAVLRDLVKLEGSVALQARGDGPVSAVMAEGRGGGALRGIVRERDPPLPGEADLALLGTGQLAFNVLFDDGRTHQSLLSLEGGDLAHAIEHYFGASEQTPTRIVLAGDAERAACLCLQRLPDDPTATETAVDANAELWQRVLARSQALDPAALLHAEPLLLLDRLYPAERLLLHGDGALKFRCTCSLERSAIAVLSLGQTDALSLAARGELTVTCEFCARTFEFDPAKVLAAYAAANAAPAD